MSSTDISAPKVAASALVPVHKNIFAEHIIEDAAYGKGDFAGLTGPDAFKGVAHRGRGEYDFVLTSKEAGHVMVDDEKRAAVVRRYRSGSITETHLNLDGSLGKHGAYHYSARENKTYALKKPDKAAGCAVKKGLI